MATNEKSGSSERNSDNSRNNNGTLGGAGGVERLPKGSFHKMTERANMPEPNENGIRENEENHTIGGHKYDGGFYAKNEIDPNMPKNQSSEGKEIRYPKDSYNHLDNPGGTSEEELDNNN
jgi:hypothetical protein